MLPVKSISASRRQWPLVDILLWVAAIFLAILLRNDFEIDQIDRGSPLFVALVLGLHLLAGYTAGPYAIGHVNGTLEEVTDLTRTISLAVVPSFLVNWFVTPHWVPRTVPMIAGLIACLAMFGARFVARLRNIRASTPEEEQQRVIIFGAGTGGRQLVRSLRNDPDAHLLPVAILDDDAAKRRWRIDGVRVLGSRSDLASVAQRMEATVLAVAIPSASSALLRELRELATAAGLTICALPSTRELLGAPGARDLRKLNLADLLGRGEVQLDAAAIAETISGKIVLVTGAGGSIGSELCRQVARFGPARLVMLDRDESGLHGTQISLTGRGLLDGDDTVLADIRDRARVFEVLRQVRPDVVFHAAALKHLPLLESYPAEAFKTNVLGTLNVLEAAQAVGVGVFVNISTDKAANPTSVLGYSKRLTERLTAHVAQQDMGRYVSVRFGNVLGSRGSVLTAFTEQIERGGPVTVTHPEVERYFMLIPEACQLVLQAAAIGADGRVMVLDMGVPVKILDVANTLITQYGKRNIDVVFTGLRPGEKLTEELFDTQEKASPSSHPLVTHVGVAAISPDDVRGQDFEAQADALAWLRRSAVSSGTSA